MRLVTSLYYSITDSATGLFVEQWEKIITVETQTSDLKTEFIYMVSELCVEPET